VDVLIDNTDWHSKQRFLKAVGHSDCVFLGSDNELQLLCDYVICTVKVKKEGIKIIGLVNENIWAVKSLNIDKNGVMDEPKIIPYEKGGGAFYNKIKYELLNKEQQNELVLKFYENIININLPEKILPWIAWIFATPFKPLVDERGEGFPILFVHGGQGSGKTSTSSLIMRLCGYSISDTFSCTMKPFPMRKILSSTNAVPIILDEFKKSDMKDDQVNALLRYIRSTYSGEIEDKGNADQSMSDYRLTAPISVMGEWNINQPAIMERVLLVRLTDIVKKQTSMQEAFNNLKDLYLEGFMPSYIQFCLNQNFEELYSKSKVEIKEYSIGKNIAPRIKNNLSILIIGIRLFIDYAKQNNIDLPQIDIVKILDEQLLEITGSLNGIVRSAVDQLIEELAIMASMDRICSSVHYKIVEHKGKKILAIKFSRVYPMFKEQIKKVGYEGDLLDKESYMKLFDQTEYIIGKNLSIRFGKDTFRSLCVDIEAAMAANINLEGFGDLVTERYTNVTVEMKQESSVFELN